MDGGSSGESQTVVQQANTAPWSGQQPYLEQGFEKAQSDVLERPLEYFPGSTVAPFSSQTQQSLDLTQNRALAGSPLTGAAQGEAQRSLAGEYLDAGNPHFQGMVDRAVRPITDQYQDVVRPGIMSAFTSGGRSGSNIARAQAENTAGNDYLRQVGDASSGLAYTNYNDERNRMGNFAQLAPSLAQQDYFDIGQLGQVGGAYDAQNQANLQDTINRYNFAQSEPTNRLAQYMGLVQGGYGSGSTSSSQVPVQSGNNVLGALGGGLMGVGMLNGLFGGGANSLFTNPFK